MTQELIIILTGMSPFIELRGAIPLALTVYQFSYLKAFFLSFFGNILPVFPLIWFLNIFSQYLMQNSLMGSRFLNWLFERTRNKTQKDFMKYGKYALIIFVAIPLPFTGAWTASVASFLFGIKNKEAFILISLGVFLAGIIVTLISLMGISLG